MSTENANPAPNDTAFRKTGEKRAGRCTAAEHEKRDDFCLDLLHRGLRDSRIKRLCADEWGVTPRAVENYIGRARKRLAEQLGAGKDAMRADAYAFYRGIVEDEKARAADRIRAQENIDRLLGLSAPTKVSVTDPTGAGPGTIKLETVRELSDEAVLKLAAAYDVIEKAHAPVDRATDAPTDAAHPGGEA